MGMMHAHVSDLRPFYFSSPCFPVGSDVNARIKGMMQAHTAGDRDMMLRQIEALKTARQVGSYIHMSGCYLHIM